MLLVARGLLLTMLRALARSLALIAFLLWTMTPTELNSLLFDYDDDDDADDNEVFAANAVGGAF